MSAKTYREKNAIPLVAKLKSSVKNLTIKYVGLLEQVRQQKIKAARQAEDIEFYKDKVQQQHSRIQQLQDRVDDLERVKQYIGADEIDVIVANAKELERMEQSRQWPKRNYGISL